MAMWKACFSSFPLPSLGLEVEIQGKN